jgi:hypothetical protein
MRRSPTAGAGPPKTARVLKDDVYITSIDVVVPEMARGISFVRRLVKRVGGINADNAVNGCVPDLVEIRVVPRY